MVTNNQIKYIKSLSQKKFRQKYNKFVVEGDKICRDLLSQSKYEIDIIYAQKEWFIDQRESLRNLDFITEEVTERELQKISNFKTPNKAVCIISKRDSNITLTKNQKHLIYLDGIQDPGNMGTIMRIADWFGFGAVVASNDCVDFQNPKVIQASMGSFINVELIESTLEALKENNPKKTVYGATLSGESIHETNFAHESILVIGNESNGIQNSNLKLVDQQITIPSYDAKADSLNAAIATAVICAEIKKPA